MPYTGLTVVIPTRNRAELAINAIRSVLRQSEADVQILVSDNSTMETETTELSAFCDRLTDKCVRYISPPKPMPMSEHWDWAMERSLETTDSSHFTYLTDRMFFKTGALFEAIEIVKHFPDKLLSFSHDKIIDHKIPIGVLESRWTGRIFEISSAHLLHLVSRAQLHPCLPRMLNSIIPRSRIDEVRSRFGNVFDSISPDFCFCFRVLEIFDDFLYLDKPILLNYALNRSNGESYAIGKATEDHADFVRNLEDMPRNFAAPIPEFLTVFNAVCHEYCLLQDHSDSGRFQNIEEYAYLSVNASEVSRIENHQLRLDMEALLVRHDWPEIQRKIQSEKAFLRKLLSPRLVVKKLRWSSEGSYSKRLWLALARLFSAQPPDNQRVEFQNTADAIEYLDRYPTRKSTDNLLLEPLVSSGEVKFAVPSRRPAP